MYKMKTQWEYYFHDSLAPFPSFGENDTHTSHINFIFDKSIIQSDSLTHFCTFLTLLSPGRGFGTANVLNTAGDSDLYISYVQCKTS